MARAVFLLFLSLGGWGVVVQTPSCSAESCHIVTPFLDTLAGGSHPALLRKYLKRARLHRWFSQVLEQQDDLGATGTNASFVAGYFLSLTIYLYHVPKHQKEPYIKDPEFSENHANYQNKEKTSAPD